MKFVLSSNYLPALRDSTDEGGRRRLIIAPFMENLDDVRDIHLKERLQEPDEMAAVLAWCVEGCLAWQKGGLGKPPRRFLQQMGMFYADSATRSSSSLMMSAIRERMRGQRSRSRAFLSRGRFAGLRFPRINSKKVTKSR